MPFDEAAGEEFEDQRSIDRRIEIPIERVEARAVAKIRSLHASLQESVSSPLRFVVNEQTQEVNWP